MDIKKSNEICLDKSAIAGLVNEAIAKSEAENTEIALELNCGLDIILGCLASALKIDFDYRSQVENSRWKVYACGIGNKAWKLVITRNGH